MASRPYQSQVAPGGTQPLQQANAAVFGAGIGDAITGLGEELDAYQREARRLRRNEENADAGVRYVQYQQQTASDIRAYQENANPGAADHEQIVRNYLDTNSTAFLDTITDPELRQAYRVQMAQFGAGTLEREEAWAAGRRVAKLGSDESNAWEAASARYGQATSIGDLIAYSGENDQAAVDRISAYTGINADQKAAMVNEYYGKQDQAKLLAAIRLDPKAAQQMLQAGYFSHLDGTQIERGHVQAEAAINRDAAQARAQEAHALSVAKDEMGAAAVALDAGGGTVADRQAMADRWEKLGDQSKAAEWRGKAQAFAATQSSVGWTLPQMDERISTLTAKQNKGGLSGAEAHELTGLKDQRGQTASRLNEPGGALLQYQFASGRTLTPLDTDDPGAMQARARQAVAAAQAAGRNTVEPILPNEIDGLKDLMNTPQGKVQALDTIARFGDARAIMGAVRQVAGSDDGDFRIAATLSHGVARDVLRGGETLRSNAGVWSEKQAALVMQQHYRRTLSMAGQGYADDVFAAAKNFYAERMTRAGETKWNPGRFAQAVETVMGRTVDARGQSLGGVARTPQGIVMVPSGVQPQAFMTRLARAGADDYARAAGGRHPRWADGSKVSERDFKRMLPTALGGGRYGFRSRDGGLIEDDRGEVYTIDAGQLGR